MADLQDRKIDELLAATKENNRMLQKLVSGARWARVGRLIYYTIIIGSAVGAYYYIQPFIEPIKEAAANPGKTSEEFSQKLFEQFRAQAEKYIGQQGQ